MRTAGCVVLVAAGLGLLTACQEPPALAPTAATSATGPLAQARDAVKRGDHAAAVALLHEAIALRSDVLEAHYLLAVSASHLDQDDEARGQFEWVVAHGQSGSAEVVIARGWLASRTSTSPATVAPASPQAAPAGALAQKPELASLSGQAADAAGAKARLLLFLKGLPAGPVQDEAHRLRTDHAGGFQFQNVVPGDYMLTDAVAGAAIWRLRISLAPAQRLVLDLSPSNSTLVRDDVAGESR